MTARRKAPAAPPSRIERDRAMIGRPDDWPRWPVLPLVRRDGDMRGEASCAFVLAVADQSRPTIYTGHSVYRIGEIADRVKARTGKDLATWTEIVAELPSRTFDSLDALLAEYRVD